MESINLLKAWALTMAGILGSAIANSLGGWDSALKALTACMVIDYLTGVVVAAVFKKSPKTENGGLESKAGFKGLCKKGMMLLMVLIAYRLDMVVGSEFIRDAVIIGYMVNEVISITENAGNMGLPVSPALAKGIEILKNKNGGPGR